MTMRDDSASYYDSQEFKDLLVMYENMLREGTSIYFDGMDLASIAEFYSLSGEFDKSDAVVSFGLDMHPGDTDILLAKTCNLIARGEIAQARVLTESINEDDNQELFYLRGCIELADDNPAQADICFQQAIRLSDDDNGMYNDIIVKFMDNRHFDLCQQWLDRALVLEPDSRNFIELQADLYFDTGQMDQAATWYDNLLDEFPYDTYYWDQLGRIYYEKNDYPKAKECFEYIQAIEPENKSALMMSAGCVFSMEEWEQAFRIYRSLLQDDKDSYTLLYYCGRCLFEQELYSQALPYLQHSFDSLIREEDDIPSEMFVELYGYLAQCAAQTDQLDLAHTYLSEGLALDPTDSRLNIVAALVSGENTENNKTK